MNCIFCTIIDSSNDLLFSSEHFVVIRSKYPIISGHILLLSKDHIRTVIDIPKDYILEYHEIYMKAYRDVLNESQKDPLVFINAPQDQSIQHLHVHFLPGVFGALGVEKAFRQFLSEGEAK